MKFLNNFNRNIKKSENEEIKNGNDSKYKQSYVKQISSNETS